MSTSENEENDSNLTETFHMEYYGIGEMMKFTIIGINE